MDLERFLPAAFKKVPLHMVSINSLQYLLLIEIQFGSLFQFRNHKQLFLFGYRPVSTFHGCTLFRRYVYM